MPRSSSGEILGVKFKVGAMKFIEIYAASVRDTMRQARRRPRSRRSFNGEFEP